MSSGYICLADGIMIDVITHHFSWLLQSRCSLLILGDDDVFFCQLKYSYSGVSASRNNSSPSALQNYLSLLPFCD